MKNSLRIVYFAVILLIVVFTCKAALSYQESCISREGNRRAVQIQTQWGHTWNGKLAIKDTVIACSKQEVGEVLAMWPIDDSKSDKQYAFEIVNGWMNSPTHKAIITKKWDGYNITVIKGKTHFYVVGLFYNELK